MYEVCPKSIQPAFISSRQNVRATSAEHEREPQSHTRTPWICNLDATITDGTPWFARSVYLFTVLFFRSSNFVIAKNDRKVRSPTHSSNLIQQFLTKHNVVQLRQPPFIHYIGSCATFGCSQYKKCRSKDTGLTTKIRLKLM